MAKIHVGARGSGHPGKLSCSKRCCMQGEMRIKARVGIGLIQAVANDPIHALDTGCLKGLDELIRNL